MFRILTGLTALLLLSACTTPIQYDVLIRNGTLYDGRGSDPQVGDLAIDGDTIAAIGPLSNASGKIEIDASGLVVAPGFINVLSWATESLLQDGRSQGNIRQGVTVEVFGEGSSMGPLNRSMQDAMRSGQGDIRYDVSWSTLSGYLEHLIAQGISPNVASFVGATTVRVNVLGYEDRAPNTAELDQMRLLVREAMREGALGVGSSLIYAPAFYASTEELIALAKVAGEFGGSYISHLRSEGSRLLDAVEELITIARTAEIPAEIYHLKAAGARNWDKLDAVIQRINQVRSEGLQIRANMYTYTAGSTGLDAAMPPWVQEGGHDAWVQRLRDPSVRVRVRNEMRTPGDDWENLYLAAGSPEKILLVEFKNPTLKPLTGKTLAQVAEMRGKSPEETAMDLVIEDNSRVGTVYFMMSEENVRKQIALPWMSFGSDGASMAPEGVFLKSNPHPRAYGNFARLLGKYVRDQGIIPLQEAIRRLTSLPAINLRLERRGVLKPGYFADIAVFDPNSIHDRATFEKPHQFATGVVHVLVNGIPVLRDGEHTNARPGRVLYGPGRTQKGSR